MAIKQEWTMDNVDICFQGQMLGYDWNQVCKEIQKCELHGMDGSGYTMVYKDDEPFDSEILNAIFKSIFEEYPTMNEVKVVDD